MKLAALGAWAIVRDLAMVAPLLEFVVRLVDRRAHPPTSVATILRALLRGTLLVLAHVFGRHVVAPIVDLPRPLRVPRPTETTRFGLTEPERRAMFTQLVRDSERDRAEAIAMFHGHEWSGEDDRTNRIARRIDAMSGDQLSVAHLVLDEGIHAGWPDATGVPVRATTPPLNPRRE